MRKISKLKSVYRLEITSQFRKDVKRLEKQKKPLSRLRFAIKTLSAGKDLPADYKDHDLKRSPWVGFKECHIENNWVLIYRLTEDTIQLIRTGTHQALFQGDKRQDIE